MIISFAHTTGAMLAGEKTVTRRAWAASHAAKFHAGQLVDAWDHVPRVKGARKVGAIRLTADPVLSRDYPEDDFAAEGLLWMQDRWQFIDSMEPAQFWQRWRRERPALWVVRFELVEVTP